MKGNTEIKTAIDTRPGRAANRNLGFVEWSKGNPSEYSGIRAGGRPSRWQFWYIRKNLIKCDTIVLFNSVIIFTCFLEILSKIFPKPLLKSCSRKNIRKVTSVLYLEPQLVNGSLSKRYSWECMKNGTRGSVLNTSLDLSITGGHRSTFRTLENKRKY